VGRWQWRSLKQIYGQAKLKETKNFVVALPIQATLTKESIARVNGSSLS
jgi:hypothetical protein